MKRTTKTTRPTHFVYAVEGEGQNQFWTKVGAAWPRDDDDGFNLVLAAMPLSGRLAIRRPKSEQEQEAAQ